MFSGNHPTTVHLNSHSSSEHCWSVGIHQGQFSFQWEHSSLSSPPTLCIGRILVNEWQCDEKTSIMELSRAAEQNDKQNKRLLMQKSIKESWDRLQIILSTITHRAATEIQLWHGAYFKQFWVFFPSKMVKWHPTLFIFPKDILDTVSYSLPALTVDQTAAHAPLRSASARLLLPYWNESCPPVQRQESKTIWIIG